jgi:LysM repeat protein
MSNMLVRKLDVRFKRSRQKYEPLQEKQGGVTNDSLDFKDIDGNEFYEPTTELTLIDDVHDGWFDVVLAPTGEQEQHVWHIFVHQEESNTVEMTSLRMSEDGLFDVQDRLRLTDEGLVTQPGILRQDIMLDELEVTNGPAAALYNVQSEGLTERGEPQLFQQGRRVMLVIPTDGGAVALSFAVGADGMLSRLQDDEPAEETLRAVQHDLLLPPETLEEIRPYGPMQEPERGTITGLSMDPETGRVLVTHDGGTVDPGQLVTLQGTRTYNHLYEVQDAEGSTFRVKDDGQGDGLGQWKAISDEVPVKQGEITALRRGEDGLLEIVCRAHGLEAEEMVRIRDTQIYDGTFPVEFVDEHHFRLPIPWQSAEGIDVAQEAARRRGVRFDGEKDYMTTPALPLKPLTAKRSPARTYSAWIRPALQHEGTEHLPEPLVVSSDHISMTLEERRLTGYTLFEDEDGISEQVQVKAPDPVSTGEWRHVALTVAHDPDADETELTLFENGQKVAETTRAGRPADPRSEKTKQTKEGIKLQVAGSPPGMEPVNFAGTMAELRVWDVARSPAELRDTLYLPLLGRERGLVGYWRMGAIGENNTVADFSIHNNDATLHGTPFVSAVTLPRTLHGEDGPVEVVGYENDELVAVTRNARYEERFEYRTDTGEQIDLQLNVWGKRSRRFKEKTAFESVVQREQEELGDGWYEVSGSYSVPGQVSMLRTFGVERDEDITTKPDWQELEIRRHRIHLISDSVTERRYADTLARKASGDQIELSVLSDTQADARDLLLTYAQLQAEEKALIREIRYLEKQFARVNDPKAALKRKQTLDSEIEELDAVIAELKDDITLEEQDPFNYWCELIFRSPYPSHKRLALLGDDVVVLWATPMGDKGLWSIVELGDNRYRIHNKALGTGKSLVITHNPIHPKTIFMFDNGPHADQYMRIRKTSNLPDGHQGYALTSINYSGHRLDALREPKWTPTLRGDPSQKYSELRMVDSYSAAADPLNIFPRTDLIRSDSRLAELQAEEKNVQAKRHEKVQERDAIAEALNASDEKIQVWIDRLEEIKAVLIPNVRDRLRTHKGALLRAIRDTSAIGTSMDPLLPESATTGALLGFVQPRNRPTVQTTSEGMVQLSYVDDRSRMRLTQFDAVYDKGAGETWLPDGLRAALDVRDVDSILHPKINNRNQEPQSEAIKLGEVWTLEAWFYYPFPEGEVDWHALAASDDGEHVLAMVDQRGRLGVWMDDGFHASDFDVGTLPNGWHHIAVVGDMEERKIEAPKEEPQEEKGEQAEHVRSYVEQPGDTWYDRERQLNASKFEIMEQNGIDSPEETAPVGRVLHFIRDGEQSDGSEKAAPSKYQPVTRFYIDGAPVASVEAGRRQTNIADLGGTNPDIELPPGVKEIKHIVRLGEVLSEVARQYGLSVKRVADYNKIENWNVIHAGQRLTIPMPQQADPVCEGFGRITEVRVWNVALNAEEIAVNSRMVLTGNEPGLVAYYPMTELKEDHVTNLAEQGGDRHLRTAQGTLDWEPCAAPIGKLEQSVVQFLDTKDKTPLTEDVGLGNNPAHTLEAWLYIPARPTGSTSPLLLGQRAAGSHRWLIESDGTLVVGAWDGPRVRTHLPPGLWHHVASVYDGKTLRLYLNGEEQGAVAPKLDLTKRALYLGRHIVDKTRAGSAEASVAFQGRMAEVRVWDRALTQDELLNRRYTRVRGDEEGLLAHWALDREGAPGTDLPNVHMVDDRMLPLETTRETVTSAEYVTYGLHPATGQRTAMMRRFFALLDEGKVELLPEKRVEALDLVWVGNAQFKPTLLGYIEGPPPVPSENLTEEDDYTGATSVELSRAEDVTYSWDREEEKQQGFDLELFAGLSFSAEVGFGYYQKILDMAIGFQGSYSEHRGEISESSIQAFSSLGQVDRLEMRGTPERKPHFPHLGTRFIPKNVGYALVISGLADVFVTRLRRSGRMVSYAIRPVPDIPPDINTITFLINPAYTMSGSLDGMTGTRATSDRFFRHVPAMRAQHGSLYPASYYRIGEAYALKGKIEEADKQRESYFAQFRTATDMEELEANIGVDEAPDNLTMEEGEASGEMTPEQKEKAREKLADDAEEQAEKIAEELEGLSDKKRKEIESRTTDPETRIHALVTFKAWQKKMESILLRAAKRNIVNTYVWDADGGLRAETQQFANTIEHTIGGSFETGFSTGGVMEMEAGAVGLNFSGAYAFNMTQTMTKSQSTEQTLELNVDLSGVESRGVTDYDDYPLLPGEKVDRYRFMTFYLENSTDNFHDFFDYVVDPEWLASNDEEARALRQVQGGKPNKTWRVLHRVTYVERPALMGFGRSGLRTADEEESELTVMQEDIETLREENRQLSKQITRILRLLEHKLE